MPAKKQNPLDKKVPFNKSIRQGLVIEFEKKCELLALDSNLLVESMLQGFLNNLKS